MRQPERKCRFYQYDGRVRLCFADENRPRQAFIWCEYAGNGYCSVRDRAARRRLARLIERGR